MSVASTAQSPSPGGPVVVPGGSAPSDPGGERTATDGGGGTGHGVPAIVRRRLVPFDTRSGVRSWIATAVIVAIAAILRLVGLSRPEGKIFDEIYYATDAHNLLTRGFEWDDKNGTAAFVVHPPLGKWAIALGEWAFGYNELGWRFSAAVAGTLSVLLVVRTGRRLFHSTTLGCAAGLLMALDGFHLVLSRSALLDIFLLLFVLASFGALLLDRDARRRRWLGAVESGARPRFSLGAVPWWRLLSGVLLGCAVSVKWSALYFLPVFGLLVLLWEVGARRSCGVRRPWRDALWRESGWLLLAGLLMMLTYLLTWSGWLLTDGGYFRHWSADAGLSEPPVLGALRNLFEYHRAAFEFHTGLTATHTYQSWPWQWLVLGRPVAFYYSNAGGCGSDTCSSEILLLGTPLLWWSFLPALAATAWLGFARRDWRALAIVLCAAAGLLPWVYYALDDRTMFYFYAAPAQPFLILAVVYVLGAIMTPVRVPEAARVLMPGQPVPPDRSVSSGRWDQRTVGVVVAGVYVSLVALCFAYFHPIYVGELITYDDWSTRMWLGRHWI